MWFFLWFWLEIGYLLVPFSSLLKVLQEDLACFAQIDAAQLHGPTPLFGEEFADVEIYLPLTIRLHPVYHGAKGEVLDILGRHIARGLALLIGSNLDDEACLYLLVEQIVDDTDGNSGLLAQFEGGEWFLSVGKALADAAQQQGVEEYLVAVANLTSIGIVVVVVEILIGITEFGTK